MCFSEAWMVVCLTVKGTKAREGHAARAGQSWARTSQCPSLSPHFPRVSRFLQLKQYLHFWHALSPSDHSSPHLQRSPPYLSLHQMLGLLHGGIIPRCVTPYRACCTQRGRSPLGATKRSAVVHSASLFARAGSKDSESRDSESSHSAVLDSRQATGCCQRAKATQIHHREGSREHTGQPLESRELWAHPRVG